MSFSVFKNSIVDIVDIVSLELCIVDEVSQLEYSKLSVVVTGRKQTLYSTLSGNESLQIFCVPLLMHSKFQSHSYWQSLVIA